MDHISKALDRIETKIDRLDERQDKADITLTAQHASLVEHVRRTNLLEAKLEPVEKHVAMMQGAIKLIGLVAIIAEIYHYVKG